MEIMIALLLGVFILATGILCFYQTQKDNRMMKEQHKNNGEESE